MEKKERLQLFMPWGREPKTVGCCLGGARVSNCSAIQDRGFASRSAEKTLRGTPIVDKKNRDTFVRLATFNQVRKKIVAPRQRKKDRRVTQTEDGKGKQIVHA